MSEKESVSVFFVDSMGAARHFLDRAPLEGEYIELYPPEDGFEAQFYRVVRICRHYEFVENSKGRFVSKRISVYVRPGDPALDEFPK